MMRLRHPIAVFGVMLLTSLNANAATMLFTSNTPDIFASEDYSLARLAGYVKAQKQQSETFFLHGGDSLFPNPLSVYDNGAHMISVMNTMTVDAMMVNRREFTRGLDQISLRTTESTFPLFLSNLKDIRSGNAIDGVQTSYLANVGKYQIGVLGYVAPTVNTSYLMGEAEVDMSPQGISQRVKALREQGADYVVMVTEPDFTKLVSPKDLAGLDVVLETKEVDDYVVEGKPLFVHSGGTDDDIVVLEFSDEGVNARVENYIKALPDPSVSEMINRYTSQLAIVLDQPLVVINTDMDSLRDNIRTQESAWGNMVVDAIKAYTRTDFAVVNSGSIRGYRTYEHGHQLTRRDVQAELPFGGAAMTVKMSPAEIRAMFENALSRYESLDGRFLQVSGLQVSFDPTRPVGQRIISILTSEGAELNEFQYRVAITDYMLRGGDDYKFHQRQVVPDLTVETRYLWNIVSEYLSKFPGITPQIEGRLINLAKD